MTTNKNAPQGGRNLEQDRMNRPDQNVDRDKARQRDEASRERSPRDEQASRTPRV